VEKRFIEHLKILKGLGVRNLFTQLTVIVRGKIKTGVVEKST
jgi:hypothetical protein